MADCPSWAKQEAVDRYGNVTCKVCGKPQSPSFADCVYCCTHDRLVLVEDWHGPDDGGSWCLEAECDICGKNFGFYNDVLISEYQLIRKHK